MFQFRFLDNENCTEQSSESPEPTSITWFTAKKIDSKLDLIKKLVDTGCINLFKCGKNTVLKYTAFNTSNQLSEMFRDYPIFRAEENDSDLLAGVYEGGQKIWECTYDLANYITEQHIDFSNRNVLDLGCGAGIIGILAFINGSSVYFQDYNEEIITYNTIPNLYLNKGATIEDNTVTDRCKFYSGDWSSFLVLTEKIFQTDASKFDYIFTCETIYNPQNYKKLHSVFQKRLKQDGIIYLAAKTHYFGVGGGLREFEEFIVKENVFNFSTCWKCSEGLQREILKITFKNSCI